MRVHEVIQLKLLVIVLMVTILSACNNQGKGKLSSDDEVVISDCSKIVIPNNIEVNTNLNKEKGIVEISWLDSATAKDITYAVRLADKDTCSESVKKVIDQVQQIK